MINHISLHSSTQAHLARLGDNPIWIQYKQLGHLTGKWNQNEGVVSCSFIGESIIYTPCDAVYPTLTRKISTTYAQCSAQFRKLHEKSMNPFISRPPEGSSGIAVISGSWFDLGIDVRAMIEQRLDNIVPTLCGS